MEREKIYRKFVNGIVKPGTDILGTVTPTRMHLLHAALGAAGEVGELVDAIKKHVIYDQPLDLENVVEELGDLEFYLEMLRAVLDIDRDTTIEDNMVKLAKRYANGYSDDAAQARADKQAELFNRGM